MKNNWVKDCLIKYNYMFLKLTCYIYTKQRLPSTQIYKYSIYLRLNSEILLKSVDCQTKKFKFNC